MIIQGNFVSQNFWTLWTAVTSGHNVLGVNVALDIVWNFGLISTLKALITSTANKMSHHGLNLRCKIKTMQWHRDKLSFSIPTLHHTLISRFMNSCQMIFQGMFVLENLWTLWTIIASGYNVFSINMTPDIGGNLGMISTLKALKPWSTSKIYHHALNLRCK